jgi:hypothetical protein
MEFISLRVIYWLPAPLGAIAFADGKEGHVRNGDIAGELQRSASQAKAALAGDLDVFTHAEFIEEAGTVIAVCLWFGLVT